MNKNVPDGQYRTTLIDWDSIAPYIKFRYELAERFLPKSGKVVEMGCGIGVGTAYLASKRPDLTFIGFDMAQDAIDYGNEYFRKYKNLSLIKLDLDQTNEILKECNLLIALEVLEHLDNKSLIYFKETMMKNLNDVYFSFPYNQNPLTPDHLQSYDIYKIFEIFPGFKTIFMRRKSIKFIGYWKREDRSYLLTKLGIVNENININNYANIR